MQKKTLLIVLCSLLVVLLGVAAFLAIYLFGQSGPADTTNYQKQLEVGNKYVENGDYDQAIAAYRSAITDDPENDEPYYLLAGLYRKLNRLDEMRAVLEEGIERTSSERLKELYAAYFGSGVTNDIDGTASPDNIDNMDNNSKEPASEEIYLSYSNTKIIANYDFEEYTTRFKNPQLNQQQGVYAYTFASFEGQVCFFDADGHPSIDTAAGQPYGAVRPNYVKLNSLDYVFVGVPEGHRISETEVTGFGASVTNSQAFDAELGSYITFVYNNCVFEIAVDDDRTFGMDSKHRLYSVFGTGADKIIVSESVATTTPEPEVSTTAETTTAATTTTTTETTTPAPEIFTNTLFIGDATTGAGVVNAAVNVHEGDTVEGQIVYTTVTDGEGNCTVELAAGNYCVEVNCSGYIVETFALEIYNTGVASVENFTISPELTQGEIRIVLEWGDSPRDLDSYLVDESGTSRVYFSRRAWESNGTTIAALDVDDRNGFGPETITVYDTSINFTYCVDDYSRTGSMFSRQDISVKVYMPGAAAPTVYTIPVSDSTARGWCVFSYIGGQLITRNTEVPGGRSEFTHQS